MDYSNETQDHREKRLASMREYAARNKEAISARKKAYKIAQGAMTPEEKVRQARHQDEYRKRKDPEAHAARKLKLERMSQGWCKHGHTPEDRGVGRICKTCDAVAKEKYRLANPEQDKQYRRANLAAGRMRYHRYTSRKRNAVPSWYTDFDDFVIEEAARLTRLRAGATGFFWHIDHVVPLQGKTVCGLHIHTNIQVIPAFDNLRKGNRVWPDMPKLFIGESL
jgi:hypothetical protein